VSDFSQIVPILQRREMQSPFLHLSLILFFPCHDYVAMLQRHGLPAFSIWLSALRLCMTFSTQRPGRPGRKQSQTENQIARKT
jgi:hypothetical protein